MRINVPVMDREIFPICEESFQKFMAKVCRKMCAVDTGIRNLFIAEKSGGIFEFQNFSQHLKQGYTNHLQSLTNHPSPYEKKVKFFGDEITTFFQF